MLLMDMFGCLGFMQVLLDVVPVRRLRMVSPSFRYGSEGFALLDGPLVAVSWYVEQMVGYHSSTIEALAGLRVGLTINLL